MFRTTSSDGARAVLPAAILIFLLAGGPASGRETRIECSSTGDRDDAFISIMFNAEWPGKKDIFFHPDESLHEFASCELEIFWPADAPADAQVMAFVKDWDFYWHQKLLPGRLKPGVTNTVSINYLPGTKGWEPRGHHGGWNLRSALNPSDAGFSILSKQQYKGRPKLISAVLKRKADDESEPTIRNVRTNTESLPCYEKFEIKLNLPDRYPDPFDSSKINLYGEFILPDGTKQAVDGFYMQDYYRVEDSAETRVSPQGKPYWCIRYAPTKEGKHSFRIVAEDDRGQTQWGPGSFQATAPVKPGYVRVSRKDPRFFEFDNRKPFFPVGHNIRSPFDTRMDRNFPWKQRWPEGSSAYERYFSKMKDSGQTIAEVWFAAWSLGLEWNADWFGYHGVGQYNLIHAFEMDRVLDLADENGIYVNLVIHNHGKFSSFSDPEWADNPFNTANGGWLRDPGDFFTDERAAKAFLKLMRYKVARWGYSSRVFAWQLWSELDLVGSKDRRGVHKWDETVNWHKFASTSIKEMDPNDHLISTHTCGDYTHQNPDMIALKEIDHCPVDAYHGSQDPLHIVTLLKSTANFNNPYRKPVLVTEFGGSPSGGSTSYLRAALHSALWSSTCIPVSGTPMFWWWGIIEEEDYYPIFAAVSRFMEGEDRRDARADCTYPMLKSAGTTNGPLFSAAAYSSPTNGLGWVYYAASRWDRPLPQAATADDLSLKLSGMENGEFDIEYWDTDRGTVISRTTATAKNSHLIIKLPRFTRDIAFKARMRKPPPKRRR